MKSFLVLCLLLSLLFVSYSRVDAKKLADSQQKQTDIDQSNQQQYQQHLSSVYNQASETQEETTEEQRTKKINYENTTDWIPFVNGVAATCSVGGFDLSPMTLSNSDYTYPPPNEGTFYINICAVANGGGCISTAGVSSCQKAANGGSYNNGALAGMVLSMQGSNVVVTYGQGQMCGSTPRSTVITISCDQSTSGTITGITTATCSQPYQVQMKSKYVCSGSGNSPSSSPKPKATPTASLSSGASPSASLSFGATPPDGTPGGFNYGWIFVIIVLVSFVIYLIGGFVYKKKREGTQGFVESIPNVEFWKDLPFLVKDGCVFVFTKIKRLIFRENYSQP